MTSSSSRRRSRSVSVTSPTARRSPDSPLRIAAKRAHLAHSESPFSRNVVARKWDIDGWRKGKRRRCDPSSSQDISIGWLSDQKHHDFSHSAPPMIFTFPASSADFNLSPHSRYSPRRHANYTPPTPDDQPSGIEMTRLRSNAFWELHKSVAENGEGFVQRMRDYERTRSRQTLDHTCKVRKRASNVQLSRLASSQLNNNEEVQIVAGEDWPVSSDDQFQRYREFCSDDSRPMAPLISASFASPLDGAYPVSIYTDSPISTPPSPSCTSPSSLSSTQSLSLDGHTSAFSIPPSPPSLNRQTTSVSSEKALSELSLALANGAGGINDYNHLQDLAGSEAVDEGGPGELWH